MKIKSIEYRETQTFGNYQNVTVGLSVEPDEGDNPNIVVSDVKAWVKSELSRRISETRDLAREQSETRAASADLIRIKEDIETFKAKWERAKAFLEKHGIPTDSYDDLPF